jgi:hypothetical protein
MYSFGESDCGVYTGVLVSLTVEICLCPGFLCTILSLNCQSMMAKATLDVGSEAGCGKAGHTALCSSCILVVNYIF